MNSIPYSVKTVYGYSKHLTGVTPRGDSSYFPTLSKHFEKSPIPIERKITARTMVFNINSIVGPWPFVMHGLKPDDAKYLQQKIGFTKLSGRIPLAGKPEAVVSAPVANNLSLKIGDTLLNPNNDKNYSPFPVKVVGILEGGSWFAFTSYEYLAQNHFPPIDVMILCCKDLRTQRQLDAWTTSSLQGERALTFTYPQLEKDTEATFVTLFKILNFVIGLLVIVITIMMGMLINIYLGQRITEFGLLQAIGHTKSKLTKRTMIESAIVVIIGWLLGVLFSIVMLKLVQLSFFDPRGYYINPFDPISYLYTFPVPIAILVVSAFTVSQKFKHFDPISVIERRIL